MGTLFNVDEAAQQAGVPVELLRERCRRGEVAYACDTGPSIDCDGVWHRQTLWFTPDDVAQAKAYLHRPMRHRLTPRREQRAHG